MADYPVVFDIARPEQFSREQVVVRLLVLLVLVIAGGSIGWLYLAAYLALPGVAAVLISQHGPADYLGHSEENVTKWIRYFLAFGAYMNLLTDRFPNLEPRETLTFEVTPNGSPTPGSSLMRLLLALPSAIVLALLAVVGAVLMIIAAVMILIQDEYPPEIFRFLRGLLRWEACLLVYLAALVEQYPPFELKTA